MLSRVGGSSKRLWTSTCFHHHQTRSLRLSKDLNALSPLDSSRINLTARRYRSWRAALGSFGFSNQKNEGFGNVSDGEEDAVKAAILEKALKGRQPSDLMLRCMCAYLIWLVSLIVFPCIRYDSRRSR